MWDFRGIRPIGFLRFYNKVADVAGLSDVISGFNLGLRGLSKDA